MQSLALWSFSSTSVKRVIVTASVASILQVPLLPNVFDEASWNEPSIKNCNELGDNASPMDMYCASKTLAEKGESSSA